MSKGSAFKVLVVGFILFVVFKPERSKQIYDELSAQLMPVQTSEASDEDRLKAEVNKVQKVLSEHEKELKATPPPAPLAECKCGGTGEVVQGDGHKTPCPCPKPCQCEKTKVGSTPPEEMEKFIEAAVQKSFDKYVADYAKRQQEKAAAQAVQPTGQSQ
jgi:hypothetical protein